MTLTARTLLLIVAIVLFVAAALAIDVRGISLVDIGLACVAAAFLVPDMPLGSRR